MYSLFPMRPPGAFKIAHRARRVRKRCETAPARGAENVDVEACVGPLLAGDARSQRILKSLCDEIAEGGPDAHLRIRQVFSSPREVFRLELERPDLGYQRTTLLDRDALEQLMETDGIAERVRTSATGI